MLSDIEQTISAAEEMRNSEDIVDGPVRALDSLCEAVKRCGDPRLQYYVGLYHLRGYGTDMSPDGAGIWLSLSVSRNVDQHKGYDDALDLLNEARALQGYKTTTKAAEKQCNGIDNDKVKHWLTDVQWKYALRYHKDGEPVDKIAEFYGVDSSWLRTKITYKTARQEASI